MTNQNSLPRTFKKQKQAFDDFASPLRTRLSTGFEHCDNDDKKHTLLFKLCKFQTILFFHFLNGAQQICIS